MVPCKEQAENRKAKRAIISYSQRWCSRPNGRRPGRRPRGAGGEPGLGFVWPRSQLGSFGQNARRLLALMLRSIAERDRAQVLPTAVARCDAHARSSSQKVSRMRAPQDEDDHRLRHSSPCQTAHLVPAPALLRPGFASLLHSPQRGVGGARRDVRCSAEHPWACT
jgi:hypothetical protein